MFLLHCRASTRYLDVDTDVRYWPEPNVSAWGLSEQPITSGSGLERLLPICGAELLFILKQIKSSNAFFKRTKKRIVV